MSCSLRVSPGGAVDDGDGGRVGEQEDGLTSVAVADAEVVLDLADALWLAELQANRLLQLRGAAHDPPVATTRVTELPRITVEHDPDLPKDAFPI